jgi:predicted MFS family arabinose efflux permease
MRRLTANRHALTALRYRDLRLLLLGQLVSAIGDQIQTVAIAWHIYTLTGSALQLGLIGIARLVPFLCLTMLGGAVADVADRKRLLLCTQAFQIATSTWLVFETLTGSVGAFTLYAVTLLSGAALAFDSPGRQALLPNMVPAEELPSALTLNTLLRQSAQIVGPGIGGVLMATVGLGWTYAANAISFLALMGALLAMGPIPGVLASRRVTWELFVGGLQHVAREPLARWPLAIDLVTRGVGNSRALLPIFAKDVFAVGPQGLGVMNATLSLGAVAGGLLLGVRRPSQRPVRLLVAAYGAEAVAVFSLGLSPTFAVALIPLFCAGVANVLSEVPVTTMIQLATPDQLRGRVSAFSNMVMYSGPSMGQMEGGAVASVLGAPGAAMFGGCAALAAVALLSLPLFRHRETEHSGPALGAMRAP